jgi:hypothetical protein
MPPGGDGLGIVIELEPFGRIQARMPLIPRRIALLSEYFEAMKEERFADMGCLGSAAIGLAWSGLSVGHWRRDFDRDLIEYGEAVQDALMSRGVESSAMYAAGQALITQIIGSMPSAEEVDEEREDFTDRRRASSDEEEPAADPEPTS